MKIPMIFVDSGPFLARYLISHPYRELAVGLWGGLHRVRLLTSSHVLDETFTLLARRAGYRFAAERAERIYSSDAFEILSGSREDEVAAVRFFSKFADQKISFTDCISFAIMRSNGIDTVFTFDRHFLYAGFKVIGLQ
jgi:hypothetical protein